MKTKIYIVASTNIESTKAFTNPLFAQDYRDELQESEGRDKVTIIEQEVEVPHATDRRKYGMTLKEIRDEIQAFKDCSYTEATEKAKIFSKNCCVPLTWVIRIRLSFGMSEHEDGTRTENRDTLNFVYYDRDGDRHTFSILD